LKFNNPESLGYSLGILFLQMWFLPCCGHSGLAVDGTRHCTTELMVSVKKISPQSFA
jgi:hypothetical protein